MDKRQTNVPPLLMLALIYFAGLAAPINQFKVPPMMKQLTADLGISLGTSGWLMSVFALVGLIFAIPSGKLLRQYGNKAVGISSLALLLSGSVIGFLSSSVAMILISRIIEGVGMCIFSISAPAAISAWFPPERRGVATGVWMTWVPIGSIIVYFIAPLIGNAVEWHPVWWFATAYTAVAFIMYLFFFQMPEDFKSKENVAKQPLPRMDIFMICMLAAIFMCLNTITISLKTYLPIFLEQKKGYTPITASAIINIMVVVSIVMGPVTGAVSDKIRSRKIPLVSGSILALGACAVPFISSGIPVIAAMVMLGISCGNIAGISFAAASEIGSKTHNTDLGVAVVAFGQYMGMSAGPIIFCTTVEFFDWPTAAFSLLGVGAAGCLSAFIFAVTAVESCQACKKGTV